MIFEDSIFNPYDNAEDKAARAFEFYEDGEIAQALDEIELALQINPANSSWHFDKALTLDSVNRFEDAIIEYEAALELNPDDLEILNSLAVDYTRTSQYDRAIELFEHIQQLDPSFEPSYCNRIITYAEMSLHDQAEEMFYLAQQINPDCALCYYNIGNSLFIRGQYKKAVHCWTQTAQLEPTHPQINYRIAQAYWADNDYANAQEHFLAELRISPGDIDVILDFGLFLLETEQIDSAREKFHRIIELNPENPAAYFYLGEIAFNNEDYQQAAKMFNQTLQRDHKFTGPRYRLAQYAMANGLEDEAKVYLVAEAELEPNDSDVLVSMGSMFMSMGEFEYAAHSLLRAVDMDFANAKAYYYLGLAHAGKEQFEEAIEFYNHTLDIKGDYFEALRDSGFAYLQIGKIDAALKQIAKAKAINADDSQLKAIERAIKVAQFTGRTTAWLGRLRSPHTSKK
ncbi:tetratricopeptide repeat protein [Planctomycetota bacterium]